MPGALPSAAVSDFDMQGLKEREASHEASQRLSAPALEKQYSADAPKPADGRQKEPGGNEADLLLPLATEPEQEGFNATQAEPKTALHAWVYVKANHKVSLPLVSVLLEVQPGLTQASCQRQAAVCSSSFGNIWADLISSSSNCTRKDCFHHRLALAQFLQGLLGEIVDFRKAWFQMLQKPMAFFMAFKTAWLAQSSEAVGHAFKM